jgi:hypothetical protein
MWEAVLWIHDILVWIQIDPCFWPMDPDPAPDPAIFVSNIQEANKKHFFKSFPVLPVLFEGTFTSFPR